MGRKDHQAAAGGLDPLLLVEFASSWLYFSRFLAYFCQLLLFFRQAAHGEHALPPLQKDGEEDQADHQGKQKQRHAITACDAIEQQDQFLKWG